MFDAGKLVRLCPGKMVGQADLLRGQQIDGEMTGLFKDSPGAGALVQAPEDQRWIEGYGVEAVGRDADLLPVRTAGGDDGYARGKVTQRATEQVCIKCALRSSHRVLHGAKSCA